MLIVHGAGAKARAKMMTPKAEAEDEVEGEGARGAPPTASEGRLPRVRLARPHATGHLLAIGGLRARTLVVCSSARWRHR